MRRMALVNPLFQIRHHTHTPRAIHSRGPFLQYLYSDILPQDLQTHTAAVWLLNC